MNASELLELRTKLIQAGYGYELSWSESIRPCDNPNDFLKECVWVIIHSGMKHEIARKIETKVLEAIESGIPVNEVFHHPGKTAAIQDIADNRGRYFEEYSEDPDKIGYLASIPWIGEITKYHLAKNLGLDVAKPDRHLERIAAKDGRTCYQLCSDLSQETGYRIATIDQILWRASLLGLINLEV